MFLQRKNNNSYLFVIYTYILFSISCGNERTVFEKGGISKEIDIYNLSKPLQPLVDFWLLFSCPQKNCFSFSSIKQLLCPWLIDSNLSFNAFTPFYQQGEPGDAGPPGPPGPPGIMTLQLKDSISIKRFFSKTIPINYRLFLQDRPACLVLTADRDPQVRLDNRETPDNRDSRVPKELPDCPERQEWLV